MKRILTILAICAGTFAISESANAQSFSIGYGRPIGNNGFLSLGYSNFQNQGFGNPYRPAYGWNAPIYSPAPVYGFPITPVYGYPVYSQPIYGSGFGFPSRGFYRGGGWNR